jgi:signal transduction histidine kinase
MARDPVPLYPLLQRIMAEYQVQAKAKGITLTLSLSEVIVTDDRAHRHQLFANLLDNALCYTLPHGRVSVVGHLQTAGVAYTQNLEQIRQILTDFWEKTLKYLPRQPQVSWLQMRSRVLERIKLTFDQHTIAML